jgi:hypothetical protein
MAETYKGVDVPHRTLRSRALEVGTRADGFDDGLGQEIVKHTSAGAGYVEQKPAVAPPKEPPSTKPFALK